MKKLILLLNLSCILFSFSQKKTTYDCSFANETKNGCNYTLMTELMTEEDKVFRIDYYNCLGKIIKTVHYSSKKKLDKDHLNGLQILYNYDGSIYSKGNFIGGKKDGLWEINSRSGSKTFNTYLSGLMLKSIGIRNNGDTTAIEYYEITDNKGQLKKTIYFAENGQRKKIIWYNFTGKDSFIQILENGTISIVDYKDSFKTNKNQSLCAAPGIMPRFKGDQNAFTNYINNNLVYPKHASDNEFCGLVKIRFVVDTDGSVKDAQVVDIGPAEHPDLEKEALRLVEKSSGMWEPGRQDGEPVKVLCIIPIDFLIE